MSEKATRRRLTPDHSLTDKERLEQAVASIGRSISEAVRVVERSRDLTEQQVMTAFRYASHLLHTASQKALLSLSIAKAANGGFSLDDPPDLSAVPQIRNPTSVQPPARTVGETPPTRATAHIPSVDDDVDFLDDTFTSFN